MSRDARDTPHSRYRIAGVTLAEGLATPRGHEVEQEKKVAIQDLLERNHFVPRDSPGGPYRLVLAIAEGRLVFDVRLESEEEHARVVLSLTPFRKVLKEYRELCDSYYIAIRESPPERIETLDMGRRGLHDEGAGLLIERLEGKIEMDFTTARQLFTLLCALSGKSA